MKLPIRLIIIITKTNRQMSKKSCNFVLTKNNPKESLGEFFSILEKDAVYARA